MHFFGDSALAPVTPNGSKTTLDTQIASPCLKGTATIPNDLCAGKQTQYDVVKGAVRKMERIQTIYHKDKPINYFDYRGLETESEVLGSIRETRIFLEKQNLQTLQLTNITGVFFTPGLIKPVLAEVELCKPYVLRDAVVGIVGAKRILFQTYLAIFPGKTKAFVEEAPALDWLVEE